MGKKEQGGGGGIELKQEHETYCARCKFMALSAPKLRESPELSPERNGINSVYIITAEIHPISLRSPRQLEFTNADGMCSQMPNKCKAHLGKICWDFLSRNCLGFALHYDIH
jgi:hypothetical protein